MVLLQYFQVSDFIGTFQQQEEEKYHLQILKFFPELNQVVGRLFFYVIVAVRALVGCDFFCDF